MKQTRLILILLLIILPGSSGCSASNDDSPLSPDNNPTLPDITKPDSPDVSGHPSPKTPCPDSRYPKTTSSETASSNRTVLAIGTIVVSGHPCPETDFGSHDASGHPCPETDVDGPDDSHGHDVDVSGHPCPETGFGSHDVSGHPCPETSSEIIDIAFLPDREAAKHWDVTPMLIPPNCDDCISIGLLEFKPAQKYIKLKIALENKTPYTGYDVRGIAVVPSPDVRLLNADGWTELWDDGGDVTRNPFKAFATDWPERQIEPYTAHARVYEFTYSALSQLVGGTQLVVDASWPGHCREAYAFDAVHQDGYIDGDSSTANFSVSLTPQDWQGDISTVLIDLSDIGGLVVPMTKNGNSYEYNYNGPATIPDAPRANIWVEVVDSAKPIRAYWLFELGVVRENPALPVPTGINAAPGEVFVDLTWDEINDPNVAGVNIYRRVKWGDYNYGMPVNTVQVKGESFKDSAVYRNVMYFYVLRCVDANGAIGPISSEVGAKPFEWGE
jgi:hypothetical protein